MTVSVDFISGNGSGGLRGHGSVATRLLQGNFDPAVLRSNASLPKDAWKMMDETIQRVATQRMQGVADLMSRGLSFQVPQALGVLRLEWQRMSDMDPAIMTMSGLSKSQNDGVDFDLDSMPLPIIHKDFNLNIRHLEASRRNGTPLDMTQLEISTRLVAEFIESLLFNGSTILGANNTIYGYKTALNRNTGSTTASWATATGVQIVGDVLAMIDKAVADNMFGPYLLYVSQGAYVHMADDYKAESDITILQRVLNIPNIQGVQPTIHLDNDSVLLVQMTSDVVDMIDGIQPMVVQWDEAGGMVFNFKVMAIMVPRVRKGDYKLQSGIVHYT
jgi:uncharacterized linocin/CFP29 family protein